MKLDGVVYECVDRRTAGDISGIVRLFTIPGGFEVHRYDGGGEQISLENDDDLEDNEAHASIIIHTSEGPLNFVKVLLGDFERMEGPSMFDTPKFKDTAELQSYFWKHFTHNYF